MGKREKFGKFVLLEQVEFGPRPSTALAKLGPTGLERW
jgi:hypothetical protein